MSSSLSSSPSPTFGCETQKTYAFPLHCKRSFNPTLTHQFEVEWPWPVDPSPAPQQLPSTPSSLPTVANLSNVKQQHDGTVAEQRDAESTTDVDVASDDAPAQLWRSRRRGGRPTFILDFSSDPFMGLLDTRRTGLLLSPGYRLLLPLTALDEPEELPDGAGRAFWKPVYKPPAGGAPHAAMPPYCAELIVGEVVAIERVVRQRRDADGASAAAATTTVATSGPSASTLAKPAFLSRLNFGASKSKEALTTTTPSPTAEQSDGVPKMSETAGAGFAPSASSATPSASLSALLARPSSKVVQSHFFYTIPYRVRWLSQLQGRLVISLPCEERLITLHAPHRVSPAALLGLSSSAEPLPMPCTHSFALPRGVVPLDIAEVFDRPFLAVGTHDHGVLLCSLDICSGAVESIVRSISLKGHGSALFPVTRLATLFPPLHRTAAVQRKLTAESKAATAAAASTGRTDPAWVQRAAALDSLRDGVVLCSSVYEPTTTLVKLDGPACGVVEDFAAMRGVETVLDVSPSVQPDLGPVLCTTARRVMALRAIRPEEEAERPAAERSKRSDCGVSDRTPPAVQADRMMRLDYPLMRLMSSPPVLQSFAANYVSRHPYTKHWRFGVDNRNQVVLLDRTVTQYVFQSSFQLFRRPRAAEAPPGSLLTRGTATAGRDDSRSSKAADETKSVSETTPHVAAKQEELVAGGKQGEDAPPVPTTTTTTTKGAKRGRFSAAKAAAAQPKTKQAKAESGEEKAAASAVVGAMQSFIVSVPLEDACSGVGVVFARDETIQVAAAHDRNYVSLVTWRIGPPPPTPPAGTFFSPVLKDEK